MSPVARAFLIVGALIALPFIIARIVAGNNRR